ncbi:MAG: hypothetical protein PCFJNLEI_02727 [Verrucomicrobiae bacterium]|nr:hypothetical protein [Verrucomicrobiae bacterium]
MKTRNLVQCALMLLFSLSVIGCASTAPRAKFTQPIPPASLIAAKDETNVKIEMDAKVKISDAAQVRLADKIKEAVATRQAANSPIRERKSFEVAIRLTNYDEGNAFARAMLAGLGQMHIDGVVNLFEEPVHTKVGEFRINKTFAWGGMYGASVSMADIENAFADGVAAALTGQKEKPKK